MAELQGYILDFSEVAAQLPLDAGKDYVPHNQKDLRDPFSTLAREEKQRLVRARKGLAAPLVLGDFVGGDGKRISHDGMLIKNAGDLKIWLPEDESYAVSIAQIVGEHILKLCGKEEFQKARLIHVTQNTIVKTDNVHRKQFSEWHDHVSSTAYPADLVFAYHSVLPTEFENEEGKLPENVVYRFGGERKHRSRVNHRPDVSRQWGAFLFEREDSYAFRPLASNKAMEAYDGSLESQFQHAAFAVLNNANRSTQWERPVPLSEYTQHELCVA